MLDTKNSKYVVLFAIAITSYYLFLPLLGSMSTVFTMIIFAMLVLFCNIFHYYSFVSLQFPGISGPFLGVSDHFYYTIYCPEQLSFWSFHFFFFFCHFHFWTVLTNSNIIVIVLNSFSQFTSFHVLSFFISWPFVDISSLFIGISCHI